MKKAVIAAVGLGGLLVASVAGAQMFRGAYDEPAHEVVFADGPFELRRYEARIVAETRVRAASMRDATSQGFGRLADYIFGGNEGTDGSSQKIAMTTPVESAPDGDEFVVVFTMPPKFTSVEQLPQPKDSRVVVRRDEGRVVATMRFGGVARNKDIGELTARLMSRVDQHGYVAESEVRIAQYDPPWIPGVIRRNELMVDVAKR